MASKPTTNRGNRLRSSLRAFGPIDGSLIWLARKMQRRFGYSAAWPFWGLSNRYENWRFWRVYDKAVKSAEEKRRGL